jgi:uncharacterized membrane protein YjjB (DUF3815 family)
MKTLTNFYFIGFSLIWLTIYTSNLFDYQFYWIIQFYLLDLIAVPILAQLGLWWMRIIKGKRDDLLSIWHIAFIVLSLSFVFEIYMPKHQTRYTADVWDILMYFLGGLFFYFVMNKPPKQQII